MGWKVHGTILKCQFPVYEYLLRSVVKVDGTFLKIDEVSDKIPIRDIFRWRIGHFELYFIISVLKQNPFLKFKGIHSHSSNESVK